MNHTEKTIPVWEKYSLNVSEATEYYGIGVFPALGALFSTHHSEV